MIHISKQFYIIVSGVIFTFVGLLHGVRAYNGWELAVNGTLIPFWVSWVAVPTAFILALSAIKHSR